MKILYFIWQYYLSSLAILFLAVAFASIVFAPVGFGLMRATLRFSKPFACAWIRCATYGIKDEKEKAETLEKLLEELYE